MPITTKTVALVWLGPVLMLWGIVCAFRHNTCGAVLALIGAASYIKAVREVRVPLDMRRRAGKQLKLGGAVAGRENLFGTAQKGDRVVPHN